MQGSSGVRAGHHGQDGDGPAFPSGHRRKQVWAASVAAEGLRACVERRRSSRTACACTTGCCPWCCASASDRVSSTHWCACDWHCWAFVVGNVLNCLCVSTWVRVCIQALLPSPSLYSLATPCQNRSSSNASCERAPGCWSRCNHERCVSRGDVRSVSDCSASARSPRNRFPCQVESLSAKEVAAIRTANLNAPLPGGTWFDGHQYMDHTGIPTPVRSRCVACACRL